MRAKYPAFILVPQTTTGWFKADTAAIENSVLKGRYRLADHEEHGVSKLVLRAISNIKRRCCTKALAWLMGLGRLG